MKLPSFEYLIPVVAAFGLSKTGLIPRFSPYEKPAAEVAEKDEPKGIGKDAAITAVVGLASAVNGMAPEAVTKLAAAGVGGPQAPAAGGGESERAGGLHDAGMQAAAATNIEDALGFRDGVATAAGQAAEEGAETAPTGAPVGPDAPPPLAAGAEAAEAPGTDPAAAAQPGALAPPGGEALAAGEAGGAGVGVSDAGAGSTPPGAGPVVDPTKIDFLQRSNLVLGKILENKRAVDPFGMVMDPGNAIEAPALADQYEEVVETTVVSNSALKNALMTLPITGVYPGKGLLVIGARSFPIGGQFGMKLQDLTIRLRFEGIRNGQIFFQDLETREVTSIPYDVRPAEFEPMRKGEKLATGGGIIPMNDLYIAN